MIRAFIRTAFRCRPLLAQTPIVPNQLSSLRIGYYFSEGTRSPTIQKIYEGVNFTNIDSILAEVSSLGKEESYLALKLILRNIQ